MCPNYGHIFDTSCTMQQNRILPVFAANRDPLLDAADRDVPGFIDAVLTRDGIVPRVPIAQGPHHRVQLLEIRVGL